MKEKREPNKQLALLKDVCKRSRKHIVAHLSLHGEKDLSAPDYQRDKALFELRLSVGQYPNERTETINGIPGWIKNGYTSAKTPREYEGRQWQEYSETYEPRRGYWSLYGTENFANIVELLPSDAKVELRVLLDHGNNQYAIDKNVHVDELCLYASWDHGKKSRVYKIGSTVLPHNTARFGTPTHEYDAIGRD
jgi:hypothetical protein